MRMDRYNEETPKDDNYKTRTNKNQELYTDVYMNNVYVDFDNLKSVMQEEDDEQINLDNLKLIKEGKINKYVYEDKIYNINTLIEKAILNKKEDNLKRNIDLKANDLKIDNLIENINENREKNNEKNDLMSDLLPTNDSTLVIPPLEKPILENDNNNDDENNDIIETENKKDIENASEELIIRKSSKKIVLIVVIIVLIIAIALIIFLFKN